MSTRTQWRQTCQWHCLDWAVPALNIAAWFCLQMNFISVVMNCFWSEVRPWAAVMNQLPIEILKWLLWRPHSYTYAYTYRYIYIVLDLDITDITVHNRGDLWHILTTTCSTAQGSHLAPMDKFSPSSAEANFRMPVWAANVEPALKRFHQGG